MVLWSIRKAYKSTKTKKGNNGSESAINRERVAITARKDKLLAKIYIKLKWSNSSLFPTLAAEARRLYME